MNEIKRTQRRYSLFNDTPLGVCVMKNDYSVLFWNSMLEYRTGIETERILGRRITDFYPKFDSYSYNDLLIQIFRGGPPLVLSSQLHKSIFPSTSKDGKPRIQNTIIKAVPAEKPGEFHALFTVDDVTALTEKIKEHKKARDSALEEIERRKIIEEKLRKSEKELLELNATKDKFFSIVAHDLKNPIGSFRSVSELITQMFDKISKEELREFIEEMSKSSTHLFKLLENLLMWSRSQTGALQIHPEYFDLGYVSESGIGLLKLNANNKGIELVNNIGKGLLVYADQNMINTVLRNLASNALKFTTKGGKVSVDASSKGSFTEVYVKDSGVGMSEEVVSKLFRIDSHHSDVGTDNEKGTGLGLILCKEFIEKQGGSIRVESKLGEGSTFIFTIPKTAPSE